MKIAVCDDDVVFLKELCIYLNQHIDENNNKIDYDTFTNPLELIAQIEDGISYDVIFLDIFMPGINGIECAKDIRSIDNFVKIVYLTSSPDFAVESYTVRAYNYLLKPLQQEQLFTILNQIEKEKEVLNDDFLLVKCKEGLVKILLSKLEFCEIVNRKVVLHITNGEQYECSFKMNELEEQLKVYEMFVRPHRSFIVNMNYIQKLTIHDILLDSGVIIPLPKEKYTQIKQGYMDYMFSLGK